MSTRRSSVSRRAFLRLTAWSTALGLAPALLRRFVAVAANDPTPDLVNDFIPLDLLPAWFRWRASAPERTGALEEEYYAVHVSWVESESDIPQNAGQSVGEAVVEQIIREVSGWFARQLSGRMLRFTSDDPAALRLETSSDTDGASLVSRLLGCIKARPGIGTRQQLHVLLVRGISGLALAAPHTVILSLPESAEGAEGATLAAAFAHLLGHALGLAHPRTDRDTAETEFASESSFMDPSVGIRGLEGSIILDSPLNPEKARLIHSGFFPLGGRAYTLNEGAVPLTRAGWSSRVSARRSGWPWATTCCPAKRTRLP